MINLALTTPFSNAFQSVMGVIVAIICVIIVIVLMVFVIHLVCVTYCIKRYYPKMQIYKGKKVINTYAPPYKGFKKRLNNMQESDKLVITRRNHTINHPINDLLRCYSCDELVGFKHEGNIYITMSKSISERYYVMNVLSKKLTSTSHGITDKEYKNLKEKNWWKIEKDGNSDKCTITRTKLPGS